MPARTGFSSTYRQKQVSVPVHQNRLEPPLEHMPHHTVPPVVRLCVHPVEMPHQQRQIALARVLYKMVVVAHEAVGQHLRIKALHALGHLGQQGTAIHIVFKNRLAPVPTRSHVVDRSGKLNAQGAGHAQILEAEGVKGKT